MATHTNVVRWYGTVAKAGSTSTHAETATFTVPSGQRFTGRYYIGNDGYTFLHLAPSGGGGSYSERHFDTWYTDTSYINWTNGSSAKLSLTSSKSSAQSVSVAVVFETEDITYSVTSVVSPSGKGTLSASPSSGYKNTQVTLTATPISGYKLEKYTTSPSVTVSNNKFSMPASNITVTAHFIQSLSRVGCYADNEFKTCEVRRYNGEAWEPCQLYYYTGEEWKLCTK